MKCWHLYWIIKQQKQKDNAQKDKNKNKGTLTHTKCSRSASLDKIPSISVLCSSPEFVSQHAFIIHCRGASSYMRGQNVLQLKTNNNGHIFTIIHPINISSYILFRILLHLHYSRSENTPYPQKIMQGPVYTLQVVLWMSIRYGSSIHRTSLK